jgi:hypothetical protein
MFRQFKEKNKNLLRLKLKSALKIEQISVVLFCSKTNKNIAIRRGTQSCTVLLEMLTEVTFNQTNFTYKNLQVCMTPIVKVNTCQNAPTFYQNASTIFQENNYFTKMPPIFFFAKTAHLIIFFYSNDDIMCDVL